mgnify:CR=1 FL=1
MSEVRADLARDLGLGAAGGDELVLVRHVDAVDVGIAHRRARRREVDLAARPASRAIMHDLARRGAAHDRVVDQQHDLVR